MDGRVTADFDYQGSDGGKKPRDNHVRVSGGNFLCRPAPGLWSYLLRASFCFRQVVPWLGVECRSPLPVGRVRLPDSTCQGTSGAASHRGFPFPQTRVVASPAR